MGASPGPSPPPLRPLPSTGTAGFGGRTLRSGTWSGLGAEYSSPSHLELGPRVFSLRHTERLQAEARCRTGKFRGREQVGTAWAVGSGLALSSELPALQPPVHAKGSAAPLCDRTWGDLDPPPVVHAEFLSCVSLVSTYLYKSKGSLSFFEQ